MISNIPAWHLEVTSRCTLACPRCPRTANPSQHNIDLDINHIKKFFTPEIIRKAEFFLFCGNFGDPIYHPNFHEIIKYFKDSGSKHIRITTNGFGRSLSWWKDLSDLLTKKDVVTFSIDGLQDTNHLYRVNSKWDSVYKAIEFMAKGNSRTRWKFIVFKHNQHQVEEAKALAEKLGVTNITIAKSRRWQGNNDPLKPSEEWCNTPRDTLNEINPKCTMDETHPHFISATGFYSPCCWYGGEEQHGPHFFTNPQFNINEHSLEDILLSNKLTLFNESLTDINTAPTLCGSMCRTNVEDHEVDKTTIITTPNMISIDAIKNISKKT